MVLLGATACQTNGAPEAAPQTRYTEEAPEVQSAEEPVRASAEEVSEWMSDDVELVIIDSRSSKSWESSETKAAGAIRVPSREVAAHVDDIPTDGRLIVYCT